MPHSFRFSPPEPRPDLLVRPRLLRSLTERWRHRVTYLAGGPGLGKTTLLAQAIAENRLAPRGEDVWVSVEATDADAEHLAHVVATALARTPGNGREGRTTPGGGAPAAATAPATTTGVEPAAVADAVWQRAPTEACLVLDDVHLVPRGSTGAKWLGELIAIMPANGHVVFAGRVEPPVSLTRYRGQGAVFQLQEDDLRFSDDELFGFADRRGLDPERFLGTGGWPAMAELAASAGESFTGDYLWEQVLEPLGPIKRQVLATVCDLGGADDDLASAALGMRVDLAEVFDGVPLITRQPGGWYVPHDLWRSTPSMTLLPAERGHARRRAATHLIERKWFDEAFDLVQGAGLWDVAPAVLRAGCLATDRLSIGQLERWMALCPAEVRSSMAGSLARGFHTAMISPDTANRPLLEAIERCHQNQDTEAEVVAIAQLGLLAWTLQEPAVLEQLIPRLTELQAAGNATAAALMTLRAAFAEDLVGNDERMLEHLGNIDSSVLPGISEAIVGTLTAMVHYGHGRPETALQIAQRLHSTSEPAVDWWFLSIVGMALQGLGRIDETLGLLPHITDRARASGLTTLLYPCLCVTSAISSGAGETAIAKQKVEEAGDLLPRPLDRLPAVGALAFASWRVAEGHEPEAAAVLAQTVERRGIDTGMVRRWWRHFLALTYVLVPQARKHWDAVPLQGHLATARDLAELVVRRRREDDVAFLRNVELPDVAVMRSLLHYRHAAELAVGLSATGRPEGLALLDALGPQGRDAVRDLTEDPHQAKAAKALLAAAPAPPPEPTHIAVLGGLELRRGGPDGELILDPDLRRQRVQALLAFLIEHRLTSRSQVMAALWPDMDERAASNNLAVTLNRLLRLLDPSRSSGEPSYVLRLDGQTIRLVTNGHLQLDVDAFEHHRAAADQAERDSGPSLALEHHLAAVELYRGDFCLDVGDAEWLVLPRDQHRIHFVRSAVRAAQLLLAQGDVNRAEAVAQQALSVDQWAEEAYAVLVGAALARQDRSAARRLFDRCVEALAELGVEPSDSTLQLQRRLAR